MNVREREGERERDKHTHTLAETTDPNNPLSPSIHISFLGGAPQLSWQPAERRRRRGGREQIKANTLVSLWDVVMTSEAAETCRACVETALITLLMSPLLHFADSSLK